MTEELAGRRIDPATMRRINEIHILRVLHAGGSMTLTELMNATGLARRTTTLAVDSLIERGLATSDDFPDSARAVGRPARRFSFRKKAGYVAAVQFAVHEVRALVCDIQARDTWEVRTPVHRTVHRRMRIGAAAKAVGAALEKAGVGYGDLWNVTMATPGLVVGSREVTLCQVLPDWSDFDLAKLFEHKFGCPVTVVNDVNAAAVAERWRGVGKGVDDLVWVLTGRRSRAAIVIGGELVIGAEGAAGEIGWLSELGWNELADHPFSFHDASAGEAASKATHLMTALDKHDSEALESVEVYARTLAPGLSALALVLNPRLMVLGGTAPLIGQPLLDATNQLVAERVLRAPEIHLSSLGEVAPAVG
ncbi:MAG: ROK family protein, partial [Acidimicrobiia bacterium]|nr:ROK family protein [Acidimicrobiia bacterium]